MWSKFKTSKTKSLRNTAAAMIIIKFKTSKTKSADFHGEELLAGSKQARLRVAHLKEAERELDSLFKTSKTKRYSP